MTPAGDSARTTVIIGAGIAGLTAARTLAAAGRAVTVLDKGRSVGGRLATRRIGGAVLDHGAQFFTVREDAFDRLVAGWIDAGLVREWCRGFGEVDGHPRFVGTSGMNSIAKHVAIGLDVRCNTLAFGIEPVGDRWCVRIDDGTASICDEVVVTCPLPQAFALLHVGGVEMPEVLRSIDYERTLGLLVTLDGDDPVIGPPGALLDPDDVFSFVADNMSKGVSTSPAVTLHANARWSRENFDADHEQIRSDLLGHARRHLGGRRVSEAHLKKWRFATPAVTWPERCWAVPSGTLVIAGDAFGVPLVEGAVLSGLAAAEALLDRR